MRTREQLVDAATVYLDSSSWSNSWHWPRGDNGRVTNEGMNTIIRQLACQNLKKEIDRATATIRDRYELCNEIARYMNEIEVNESP